MVGILDIGKDFMSYGRVEEIDGGSFQKGGGIVEGIRILLTVIKSAFFSLIEGRTKVNVKNGNINNKLIFNDYCN